MDGAAHHATREESAQNGILRTAQVSCAHPDPIGFLATQLGHGPFDLVCLFVSPQTDFHRVIQTSAGHFGDANVMACTTAGEIGQSGYENGQIIAVAFPSQFFHIKTYAVIGLDNIDETKLIDDLLHLRLGLMQSAPNNPHEFAFLMVDGLSKREEHLTDLLASGLGPMPLFGGSSADDIDFNQTWLSHNGKVLQNAAVLAMVRTKCPVKVFSHDHLRPTDERMVVTAANPEARVVREINGAPAALEYARILGKDPNQLTPFTFASHPVVVRVGEAHHVRAIQRVTENNNLLFFSAINEGMVLSLTDHEDIASHLDKALSNLGNAAQPEHILGCDCILRRVAAEQTQKTREISNILAQHNVVGFGTYGEQIGSLHVNQTLTGVAIYRPLDTSE